MNRMSFRASRAVLAGLLAGAVGVTTVALAPVASGAPGGTGVVINEVYLNGGSTGATYKNKFVELHNPTGDDISLAGWSVQYRSYSSTTAFTRVTPLEGHLPPGGTYLVGANANSTNGADLPTPDVSDTGAAYSGNANGGTLALVSSTTALTGDRATVLANASLVDLIGYGVSNTYEGSGPEASGYSVTASLSRTAFADTDDNLADFSSTSPTPTACGDACVGGGGVEGDATIAEIQGTEDQSPADGNTVTTEGVVTATYPSGGFNGFYLQTEGTGGDIDLATHEASDGIFVFGAAEAAAVEVGDFVEVTGEVSEFNGLTEITPEEGGVVALEELPEEVKPATVTVPGTAGREALEGMLLAPQGPHTVTNNFATHTFGEVGLAIGDEPLQTPTNIVEPDDNTSAPGSDYDNQLAYNNDHLITLDDGSPGNYTGGASNVPVAWLTPDNEVRVGADVTFVDPVILDYRFGWKLQPTVRLSGANAGDEPVTFTDTRTAAPEEVGGDVSLATFNVLNYFTTLGKDVAGCEPFVDRQKYPTTVDECPGNGPRGAWDEANLARQEAKIVEAINGLDADVVSLEEIENSLTVDGGTDDRDTALATLTDALNEDAGAGTWDFVPSPAPEDLPASEDVIRTAFIYQPDAVEPVGDSVILDDPAFANARQPLAQSFQPVAMVEDDEFLVIVNHFKSKGSGSGQDADAGDGQGASNHSRVLQAEALVDFAADLQGDAGTDNVYLSGDFNSYTMEDPLQVLEDAGYVNVAQTMTDEETYQFQGQVGSLDHVFASPSAYDDVTGADIWNINSYEAVGREYSRFNANITNLYVPDAFRASDHDPILVGIDTELAPVETTVTATAEPHAYGTAGTVDVVVEGEDGSEPSGEVSLFDGEELLGTEELSGGQATFTLEPRALMPGAHELVVRYAGEGPAQPSESTVTVQVTKAKPEVSAEKTGPAKVKAGKSRAKVAVEVTAEGVTPEGIVVILKGKNVLGDGTLSDGRATIELPRFAKPGKQRLKVRYLGDDVVSPGGTTLVIRVVRK